MKYMHLSISELHDLIIKNQVTPLELVKEALELAKGDNHNAFEYICEKEAIENVNKLDPSKKNNILYGIPFVVKDNFSTKDIPTTASSNILKGYIPSFDSEVVTKLKEQGAILIGKTTMDELAMGGRGTNGHLGVTYNPWDKSKTRIVGGSSSGSAAALAAGLVPFAIGSDTGDSARKPASYSGLVGFKPTWGRISRFGLFEFACSLDHVGYFTRNVKDSAILLNVLAGRDDKDFSSSFKPVDDYLAKNNEPIKGKKIAIIREIVDSIIDKNVLDAFNKNVYSLKQKGAVIDYVDVDIKLLKAIYPTYIIISCAEATSNYASLDGVNYGQRKEGKTFDEVLTKSRTEGISMIAKRRLVIGGYSLLKENADDLFIRAQKCRRLIVNAFNKIFEEYDAIYVPAAPSIAPKIDETHDGMSDEYLIADNYMAFANMGGFPSICLPLGFEDGMPFGVNLTCKPFEEAKLFGIAREIEDSTGLSNIIAGEGK